MKKIDWLSYVGHFVILFIFLIASAIYFFPALEGKIVYAGDNINGKAAVQESAAFHEQTGEYSFWTGSMFSGMPNYQIGGNGGYIVDKMLKPLRWFFMWGNRNAAFIFLFYLCAFYLLLRAFKIDKWLSMAGAFAISMSSYFFIIIAAQHHGKCYSITWMTLVVIGFILTYRKQYGWGALLVMFFTYIGFFLHPQMSYYICMMIGIFFFAELYLSYKAKEWKHFAIATALFIASFGIGMGMGSANVFSNMEYAQETMRGGHSDLVKDKDATNKTEGLDLDYATAWSYGINETITFLVPNYMGGASGYNLGDDSQLEKDLKRMGVPARQARQFCQGAPTYWGEKAFTSGPVYMGAIVCLLFVLGLLIVSGPYKWALLIATLFSVALAWGRNFMPLTELFFNYFPMYNKFRAVESILIVAEITIPLLAFLALKAIHDKTLDWKKLQNSLWIAGGVTGGLCALIALMSGSIDVTSTYDAQWKSQVGQAIYDLILSQRAALIASDAWRSLLFILFGLTLVYAYAYLHYHKQPKNLTLYVGIALTCLIVGDMWTVNKRFCNDSMFVSVKERDKTFKMLPYEQRLLEDTTHFRVLNLSTNTFNEARTSYYLKSIGGYSAAKLRRYQDMIDVHIVPEMQTLMQTIIRTQGFTNLDTLAANAYPVLNMLNMKYAIVPLQNKQVEAIQNPFAMGNCWFVDRLQVVNNANDEIAQLKKVDLHQVAVVDTSFVSLLDTSLPAAAPLMAYDENYIHVTKHQPNKIMYESQSEQNKVAVFSEVYYPHGWHLYLLNADGSISSELPLARVNYILRAAVIPAGHHMLCMVFEPDSVKKGNTISLICFIIMCLSLIGVVGYKLYRRKH
ncbi:MAG: hypothetical protein J6J29_00520 [Paludibacteraceae bacterium]|nr:hypothetical protein [Paludibacteraceae bacterium]